MKIINAGYKVLPIPEPTDKMAVLKHLELIGRTCYKSEDKITDESCLKFVQNIRDRKHWAMLEHYIFSFFVPEWIYSELYDNMKLFDNDPFMAQRMPFVQVSEIHDAADERKRYLVSASATALNYLWDTPCYSTDENSAVGAICVFMMEHYPELMVNPDPTMTFYGDDEIMFCGRDEMKKFPEFIRLKHDFMSVRFTVDRGVTHELVRHRPCSWAQESTRYCNYSAGKYGGEITVILPYFFDIGMGTASNSLVYEEWKRSCESDERHYMKLLEYGATPQQARSVLPQSTKAEIVMTTYKVEMLHFFDMRADTAAHPQMREVAVPLLADCIKVEPDLFSQYKHRLEENHEFVHTS